MVFFINVKPELSVEEMFNNTKPTSRYNTISGCVIFYLQRAGPDQARVYQYNINILPAGAHGDHSLIQSHKVCFPIQNDRIKLRNFSF